MDRDLENLRLPVIGMTKLINDSITDIDKRKLFAIAKDTNKKFGLITNVIAKNAARVNSIEKQAKQQEANPLAGKEVGSINALTESLHSITASFADVNKMLALIAKTKMETASGQQQEVPAQPAASTAAKAAPEQPQSDMVNQLKGLFTNPAVLAALSGIVYLVLPKEMQDKVKSFFGGFSQGINDTMQENESEGFGGFNTALKATGVALAAFFGVKLITSLVSAISTVMSVISSFSLKSVLNPKTLAVAGAAVAGGVMMAMSGDKKKESEASNEPGEAPSSGGVKPEAKPSTAGSGGPAPSGEVATTTAKTADSDRSGTTSIKGTGTNVDLKSVMTVQPGVETEGINPALKQRLGAMASEYQQKTGKKMILTSGFRDSKKQAELFAKIGRPNAAPPGTSLHEKGLAIDMNSADANQAVALGLFDKYGFKRPVKGEAWHVEPVETRSGPQFADNPSAPGQPVAVVTKAAKPQVAGSGKEIPASQVAAVAQPPTKTTGDVVNQVSAEVNNGDRPNLKKQLLAKVNNSTDSNTTDKGVEPAGPIPSPVARRGSLSIGSKFLTAYA